MPFLHSFCEISSSAAFLTEHPDTVLVIIDTLQMIRGTNYDNTYANDYRDLSALKRIADTHGIAILLIHHLRKETADDVFSRISGTTAISGAVDSSNGKRLIELHRAESDDSNGPKAVDPVDPVGPLSAV